MRLAYVSTPAIASRWWSVATRRSRSASTAASLLKDKVLDASVEQNQVAFTIAEQVEE